MKSMKKTVLIPLPSKDFDPTEVSVPWKILTDRSVQVIFTTPAGLVAQTDLRMLNGTGLGILAPFLKADNNAQNAYAEMVTSKEFLNPIKWSEIDENNFDGILLPGGHAPGMREYLESTVLQQAVSEFFNLQKSVGAICHGVVLAARSKNSSGQSALFGRKTTALLKSQELMAWSLTRLWLGSYYRTYPVTVEDEVRAALKDKKDFVEGPLPLVRDSDKKLKHGFCLRDGNYISARWPGDAHAFAHEFYEGLA
jgi:protease I